MLHPLQIYDPRERALVRVADAITAPLRLGRSRPAEVPRRVLLLRLERIGDLLMTLDAIALVRSSLPDARIDLAVGEWNRSLARRIAGIDAIEILDAPWLARDGGASWGPLLRRAWSWRARRYDLVVNFEPDIRSNFLAWLSGGRRRLGYWTGGGGAFLTDAAAYDPARHVSENARSLALRALGDRVRGAQPPGQRGATLVLDPESRRAAAALLPPGRRPLVGIHASGGREIKQWPPERFSEVARRLIADRNATIVLTGDAADRPLVERVRAGLPADSAHDLSGVADLPVLAAVLERLDLFVSGDTGPMHLAHAVGTPVVAIFGPSDPARYAPGGPSSRVVRVDLPCSPCNRIRRPPARCVGVTPECLTGVSVDAVLSAVQDLLEKNHGGEDRARQSAW